MHIFSPFVAVLFPLLAVHPRVDSPPPQPCSLPCNALPPSAYCSVCCFSCGSSSLCPFFPSPPLALQSVVYPGPLPCYGCSCRLQFSSCHPSSVLHHCLVIPTPLPPTMPQYISLDSSSCRALPCSMFFGVPTALPDREKLFRGRKVIRPRASLESTAPGKGDSPNPSLLPHSVAEGSGASLHPFPVCDWSRAHLLFPRSVFLSSPSPFALLCPY